MAKLQVEADTGSLAVLHGVQQDAYLEPTLVFTGRGRIRQEQHKEIASNLGLKISNLLVSEISVDTLLKVLMNLKRPQDVSNSRSGPSINISRPVAGHGLKVTRRKNWSSAI
jgi:hypothetical protein